MIDIVILYVNDKGDITAISKIDTNLYFYLIDESDFCWQI